MFVGDLPLYCLFVHNILEDMCELSCLAAVPCIGKGFKSTGPKK